MTRLRIVGSSSRGADFERGVVRGLMVVLFALCVWVLTSDASDFNVFKVGCVATEDTTLVVPVIYGTDFYAADSLSIAVVTIEYDGTVARFRSVEAARPDWAFLAINDNQHVPECAAEPPLRRITFIVDGNLNCNTQISNDALAYVRFGMVSRATTGLHLVPDCGGGRNMNHGSNCTGSSIVIPHALYDGCAAFAHVATDVGDTTRPAGWSFVKGLFR